jgi:tetratricopeptide (TPR) repeat protein
LKRKKLIIRQISFRINLADLLSKLNQNDQAQRILDQLLKEEGYSNRNLFRLFLFFFLAVPNTNFQHGQQVTKAYEILANICEQSNQFEETKQYLTKAKDNQKKLLKRIQLEEGDIQKENQKLYCK